ncbi:MAG: hypothetical protein AAGC55_04405, partial [Myxococcota bacterium]
MVSLCRRLGLAALVALVGSACSSGGPHSAAVSTSAPPVHSTVESDRSLSESGSVEPEAEDEDQALSALHAYEEERRQSTDFSAEPAGDRRTGADPFDLVAMPAPAGLPGDEDERFVGLLRGADAVVIIDGRGRERVRVAAPRAPSGLAVDPHSGVVYVSGAGSPVIARYRIADGGLTPLPGIAVPDALAIVDIALGPEGVLYIIEEFTGRLLVAELGALPLAEAGAVGPPVRPPVTEVGR